MGCCIPVSVSGGRMCHHPPPSFLPLDKGSDLLHTGYAMSEFMQKKNTLIAPVAKGRLRKALRASWQRSGLIVQEIAPSGGSPACTKTTLMGTRPKTGTDLRVSNLTSRSALGMRGRLHYGSGCNAGWARNTQTASSGILQCGLTGHQLSGKRNAECL